MIYDTVSKQLTRRQVKSTDKPNKSTNKQTSTIQQIRAHKKENINTNYTNKISIVQPKSQIKHEDYSGMTP